MKSYEAALAAEREKPTTLLGYREFGSCHEHQIAYVGDECPVCAERAKRCGTCGHCGDVIPESWVCDEGEKNERGEWVWPWMTTPCFFTPVPMDTVRGEDLSL